MHAIKWIVLGSLVAAMCSCSQPEPRRGVEPPPRTPTADTATKALVDRLQRDRRVHIAAIAAEAARAKQFERIEIRAAALLPAGGTSRLALVVHNGLPDSVHSLRLQFVSQRTERPIAETVWDGQGVPLRPRDTRPFSIETSTALAASAGEIAVRVVDAQTNGGFRYADEESAMDHWEQIERIDSCLRLAKAGRGALSACVRRHARVSTASTADSA